MFVSTGCQKCNPCSWNRLSERGQVCKTYAAFAMDGSRMHFFDSMGHKEHQTFNSQEQHHHDGQLSEGLQEDFGQLDVQCTSKDP